MREDYLGTLCCATGARGVETVLVSSWRGATKETIMMLEAWDETRPVVLHPNLAPWRQCFLLLALTPKSPAAAKELASLVGVNTPLPAARRHVEKWLWKTDHGPVPEQEHTRPLHEAMRQGAFEAAEWLLEQGADPRQVDSLGRTALEALEERIAELREDSRSLGLKINLGPYLQWHQRLRVLLEQEVLEESVSRAVSLIKRHM